MSYVEFDAFKQTSQYRKALCDALAITARKGGNPIPGVVDSEMNRAFQALNKISPALATGIAYTGSVGNKMYNYFLSDAGQNALRIAEQAATGALDGLTLGWIDEINGATNALGYGIGAWATGRENPWDAMKRGYIQGRDNRRQVLQQGLNENPALVNTMQVVGAIASPVNHTNIFGQAPVLNHLGRALQNPIVGGSVAGFGTAEGNWQNQARGTLFGAGNGFASSLLATPWSKKFNYAPQNYTGGNYAHNILQPTLYYGIDKIF